MKNKENMLISVDFDGTIVDHSFPEIGEFLEGALETLKDLQEAGHILILNTCREDERRAYLTEAVDHMKKHGIEFASVNTNRPEDEFRDKPGRKIYAHIYIDDRNFGGFPGWLVIREAFGFDPIQTDLKDPGECQLCGMIKPLMATQPICTDCY